MPIRRVRNQSVFYGIEMDVVDVRAEIVPVANRVFPKAALPDAALALGGAGGGARLAGG
jgi:hypothetical protein